MIRILLIVGAILFAGAAWWLFLQNEPVPYDTGALQTAGVTESGQSGTISGDPASAREPTDAALVEVLIAQNAFVVGQQAVEGDFAWSTWPAQYVLSQFVLRTDTADPMLLFGGQLARVPIPAGEPIRRDSFAEAETRSVSQRLAPGMRAVSIRVNVESAAGGFILPGDRVDVVHTETRPGFAQAISTVVASNVRVLALDLVSQSGGAMNIEVERTATLEIDRDGAAAIISAQENGSLTLVLRAVADRAEQAVAVLPVSQTIAAGMRAVVLPNIEVSAGAFITLDDRVDVVHTFVPEGQSRPVSRVVAYSARVISVDQIVQTGADDRSVVNRSATLEVSTREASAIAEALLTGQLTLSLRSDTLSEIPEEAPRPTVTIHRGNDAGTVENP